MLVPEDELVRRAKALEAAGGYKVPDSQSPWQVIFRDLAGQFDEGLVLRGAEAFRDIAARHMPRDNH